MGDAKTENFLLYDGRAWRTSANKNREITAVMFYLGEVIKPFDFPHNFGHDISVLGIEIAQQSISCGDNCTPQ
jgi:hypothetical protein